MESLSLSTVAVRQTVSDLQTTSPLRGLLKAVLLFVLAWACIWGVFVAPGTSVAFLYAITAGILYASLLVLTHDGIHQTLTGWKTFDGIFPRIVSYPILWPHALYSALHMLHHKMNGNDPRDPERVAWTETEYAAASSFGKWRAQHQWAWDMFFLGGLGLIGKQIHDGFVLGRRFPQVRRALHRDIAALVLVNGAIWMGAAWTGYGTRYLIMFFCMERIIGIVHQFRSHIEHYGVWSPKRDPLETQIMSSRNIRTSAFASWFLNRLNFHSMHHAFPRIPFYRLEEAHRRVAAIYAGAGKAMPEEEGYLRTGWRLAREITLIAG